MSSESRLFLLALLLTAALAGAFAFAPQSESAKPQNFAFANLLAAPAFAQNFAFANLLAAPAFAQETQEAAAQEAPVPSWVCRHVAPDVDLVCNPSCRGGERRILLCGHPQR